MEKYVEQVIEQNKSFFDYEQLMLVKELIIDAYIKAGEDKKDENL